MAPLRVCTSLAGNNGIVDKSSKKSDRALRPFHRSQILRNVLLLTQCLRSLARKYSQFFFFFKKKRYDRKLERRRSVFKEKKTKVHVSDKEDSFMFLYVNGTVKFTGKISEVGPSNRIRQDIGEGEEQRSDLQGETDKTDEQDELEANHDFWSISGSFACLLSGRTNCTCHKKSHFPFHSKLMLSDENKHYSERIAGTSF